MTEEGDRASGESGDGWLALRRLELDLQDLRFENARLKVSIAERQAEIEALSERLGALQARLVSVHRVAAWGRALGRLGPLRLLLRRR